MQPNVFTNNRAPQLGQYQSRSNYDYSVPVSSYRSHQRTMISNGDMNTVGFHNFNGGASSLFSNVPSANICNISDAVQILNPSPITCNVKFRRIPFFKLRREILKPSILSPTLPQNLKTDASPEFQFGFVMTCAMASELAMNRDMTKSEFSVLAQLRITMVDIGSPASATEHDDFLPLGLVIRVNGRPLTTLPPCVPSSRPNQEARRLPRPINVTHLMKLSPVNANILTVNWTPESGKQCIITMNIVEKLSAGLLLDCLKEKPRISVDITKATIRQQYRPIDSDETSVDKMVDDEDIATTIVRVSLLCPLAKFRMQYPAKGKNCTHLQCFDGSAYISLNEKKPMWNCPVCNKCLHYDDLLLDEYFMNVIQNEELSGNCYEVQLFVDGTWKSYFEDQPSDKSDLESKKKNSLSSSTEKKQLTNPSEESSKDSVSSTSESVVEGSGSNCDVVNLLSDDEDASDTGNVPNITAASPITNPTDKKKLGPTLLDKVFKEPEEAVDDAVRERARTLPITTPDTSSMTTNVKKNHQASGIISLDSPSPPSLAKLSSNDLSS